VLRKLRVSARYKRLCWTRDHPTAATTVWRRLFRAPRAGREWLMFPNERALLRGLPARVELRRGFSKLGGEAGITWTPDIGLARALA
jgi:hypothetical protein